jgi:hypothetical protein
LDLLHPECLCSMRIAVLLAFLTVVSQLRATDRQALSASETDVEAKIAEAATVNGDTILIPNGSATWNHPLNTQGKRLIIRAQNITSVSRPTPSTTRNVVITYTGTTGFAIDMTSGNDFHVGVGGIKFLPPTLSGQSGGSGIWGYIHFTGSGTKPPLVFDCWFVANERQAVTSAEASFLSVDSLGGVIWDCLFDGSQVAPGGAPGGGDGVTGAGFHLSSPRGYTTASTMGTADSGGLTNLYVEDCNFLIWGQADVDNNGRLVFRRSTLNGCSWQTHGFTSSHGGRHVELYDNDFLNNHDPRNFRRYFWLRAGTVLITGNTASNQNTGFGVPIILDMGDNTNPISGYPANRTTAGNETAQPGFGWDGSQVRTDAVYVWNNTGGAAQSVSNAQGPNGGEWVNHIVLNRDYFVSGVPGTAKPATLGSPVAWVRFAWPHPLRSVITGGSPDTTPPTVTSASINAAGTQLTLNFDETVSANTVSGLTLAVGSPGAPVTVTGVASGSGTASVVFSLSRVIGVGQTLTRTYVQPGNGIEDTAAGNDLANFTTQSVTNNSTQDITPPVPSPMTFLVAPFPDTLTSVSMTATTATDATSPPVQYFFDETSGNAGGTDSGWQSSPTYIDTFLTTGTTYTYRVKARDAATGLNETVLSAPSSATPVATRGAYPISPANSTRSGIISP